MEGAPTTVGEADLARALQSEIEREVARLSDLGPPEAVALTAARQVAAETVGGLATPLGSEPRPPPTQPQTQTPAAAVEGGGEAGAGAAAAQPPPAAAAEE